MPIAVMGSSTHTEAMFQWANTVDALPLTLVPLDTAAVLAEGLPPGDWQAAMAMDRDPETRRASALTALNLGLPVFVDKPLALTRAQASQLLAAERNGGARLASFSALRWRPEVDELNEYLRSAPGSPRSVRVGGPVDASSPWGGIAFYASHVVELALQLAPGPVTQLHCEAHDAEIHCTFRTTIPVSLTLKAPDADFEAEVSTSQGSQSRRIVLPHDYYRPTCERIADFLLGGPALTDADAHLGAALVLEAACHV